MKFINLEQHSYYSMPQGILSLEEINSFYKKHNIEYVLTDIHSTAGNLEKISKLKVDDKFMYGCKVKVYPDLLLKKILENIEEENNLSELIEKYKLDNFLESEDELETYLEFEKKIKEKYYFINVYPKNEKEYILLNKAISSQSVIPLSDLSGSNFGISNGENSIVDYYSEYESDLFFEFMKDEDKFIILNIQGNIEKLKKNYDYLKKCFPEDIFTFSFNSFILDESQKLSQEILVNSWAKEDYATHYSYYPIMNFSKILTSLYGLVKDDIDNLVKNSIKIFDKYSIKKESINISYPEIATKKHFILNKEYSFINKKLIEELELNKNWNLNKEFLLKTKNIWDCDFLSFSQKEEFEENLFDKKMNESHRSNLEAIDLYFKNNIKNKIENELDCFLNNQETKKEILFKLLIFHNKIDLKDKKYFDRIILELEDISYNGTINLIDYFLHLESIIRKAKNTGSIFDFGRGSSVASLICFGLDITDCDPIAYKLKFERFMSKERTGFYDFSVKDSPFKEFKKN